MVGRLFYEVVKYSLSPAACDSFTCRWSINSFNSISDYNVYLKSD